MNTKIKSRNNSPLSLGDFLRNHRIAANLGQNEMANLLGISKQRLCDIEKNRCHVSLKLCKELAQKLDLPPEWLAKLVLQTQIDEAGLELKVG